MRAWRALLAGVVVVGLAVGLVYAVLDADTGGAATTPTLASATTVAGSVPATVGIAPVAPAVSTTTRTPLVTSTSTTPPPVVLAMRDALAAWGKFAVTGRTRDLGEHFVPGGPQRRKLRSEAEALRADPPGLPAYQVTTGDVFTISMTSSDVVLRTDVMWAREGEQTQLFTWDIQMQLVDGSWRLLTVDDAVARDAAR